MDGEKNGKPPLKWMIWGETPHYFRKHPKMIIFLVGKPMVVGYHHFRKHPYLISEVYPTSNLPGCHVRNTSSRRRSIFVRPRGVGRTCHNVLWTRPTGPEQEKKERAQSLRKHNPTPWKINMDHNHGGLEDHFPF